MTAEAYGRPLSVALNMFFLTEVSGGVGRYAREMVPALLRCEPMTRIVAFVSKDAPRDVFAQPWSQEVDWVVLPLRTTGPRGHWTAQTILQNAWLPLIAPRRDVDVLHGLANTVPPFVPGAATVVTLLDVTWLHYPQTIPSRAIRVPFKAMSLLGARWADRVIAISEAAREDFVASIGLTRSKIDVAPLGITDAATAIPTPEPTVRSRLGLDGRRIVLSVAQKNPHKNLASLIRAIAGQEKDVVLVLPGSPTQHERELRALASELGVTDRVRFPGWLSEEDLEGLYRAATCFVLPSFMEGFGLPILEAMRRAVPVACSNRSSLPEVAGDAALLFDPEDQSAVTAAIGRLLNDRGLATQLAHRGRERCREFPWERTAEATLASYRRAIVQRRTRARGHRRMRHR
ncbi:MAG: glycosyltransferase family 4 protein [Thermoleophilaceae bacterium]